MRVPRNGFTELRDLGLDGITQVSRLKEGLECPLRQIRYRKNQNDYTLVTTLLDPQISRSALCKIYGARWGIEEFFKTLKQVGKIEQLHARSKNGILQEIYAFLLLHTMTVLMQRTGKRQKRKKAQSTYKGAVKYNHTLAFTLTSQLSPLLLQVDIQSLRGLAQLPGYLNIRGTRRRVAGRMIMHANERRCPVLNRAPEDFPRMRQ